MRRHSATFRSVLMAAIAVATGMGAVTPQAHGVGRLNTLTAAISRKASPKEQPAQVETIVLAADGLSYNAFKAAQAQGLFKEFANVGAHVAPFPSMTDLSWSTIMNTAEIFGAAGRIKSVEATYFDESTQSVQGDPRDYYRRLAFPKYYMGGFGAYFNPYVEGLMYFPTEEVPKLEVKSVVDDLAAAKPRKVLTGYVGAIDSMAHTQKGRLFPTMKLLDAEIKRLIKAYKDKGRDVEIVLLSDHGNIGRFAEGKPEQELIGIDVSAPLKRGGFNFVQQLRDDKDVTSPLMALGSWGPMYLKNRKNMPAVIAEYRKESWFDLAVYINRNTGTDTIMTVISNQGEAQIQYDKKTRLYYYYDVKNNPLQIPAAAISTKASLKPLTAEQGLAVAAKTSYPDSLFRIIESASERNFDFPDFILTLKDGFYIQSSLGAFTKMIRTHGSLSANSSFGVMASTKRAIPNQIRSKDIMPLLDVDTRTLFGRTYESDISNTSTNVKEAMRNYQRGVETDAKDLSQQRIFQYLTRFVSDTRPYFLVSEMKSFMDAFKLDPLTKPGVQTLSPMNFDFSKFDAQGMISPEDIGQVTDVILTAGSAEKMMKDPRINKLKDKVNSLRGIKEASVEQKEFKLDDSYVSKVRNYVLTTKRGAMKLYQTPYLLEKSLNIQEKPFIKDTRDLRFAQDWLNGRDSDIKTFKALNKVGNMQERVTKVQSLMKEAIKEAELEERIFPTPLDKAYNRKNMNGLTIVYIPGLYNSIFDKEIFSLGLNALSDEMGLRVIQPPVEATCSGGFNGDIIADFLKQDAKTRIARGQAAPRYMILGYSKGAVDTLNFMVKNRQFTSTYVKGFVAIAAPLHGSSILNKTDLPFALVSALSEKDGPGICKNEKAAAKSLDPSAMQSFWRKNERSLIGLTRYYSVTFESDPEDSHIFMKATKLIAQFDENNDGVVTTSSSKFPDNLAALDLGTMRADHLAGILASRFNQKAFMKGLVNTLGELDANNDQTNMQWNTNAILTAANAHPLRDRMYYRITKKGLIQRVHLNSNIVTERGDISPYSQTWELNHLLLPPVNDPADDYQPQVTLPPSQIKYDPYGILDVQKLPDIMSATSVTPVSAKNLPQGINMEFHHKNMVHFRMDHQFNYESRSPLGNDDNKNYGYINSDFNGEKDWVAMRSLNNSIRMTTLSYRFSPIEFSKMSLKLAVTKGVNGADPVKGHTGKDDSAFQVWFTIRDGRANDNRALVDAKNDRVFLFGYYWGDPVPGENRKAGDIFENWYSNKNIVVATLPEAKQLVLNNPDMLGKPQLFERNLAEDLKLAFPNRKVEDMDIVGITIQHDSNDTEDSSEAYFKWLKFMP